MSTLSSLTTSSRSPRSLACSHWSYPWAPRCPDAARTASADALLVQLHRGKIQSIRARRVPPNALLAPKSSPPRARRPSSRSVLPKELERRPSDLLSLVRHEHANDLGAVDQQTECELGVEAAGWRGRGVVLERRQGREVDRPAALRSVSGVESSVNGDGNYEAKRRSRCRTYEFLERSCTRLSRQLAYSFRLNARRSVKLTFVRVPIHFVLVRDVQDGGKHAVGRRAAELPFAHKPRSATFCS